MDTDTSGPYKEERYKEIADEMKHMLIRVGWKDTFLEKSVPILPISGWMGDNLIKKSENMAWYKGKEVETLDGRKVQVRFPSQVWSVECVDHRRLLVLRA